METYTKNVDVLILPSKDNIKTNLGLYQLNDKLHYYPRIQDISSLHYYYKHLYILSSDVIKEGDWYANGRHLYQADSHYEKASNDKKIIATTDGSLTTKVAPCMIAPHGADVELPQPCQEFIEDYASAYNKNTVVKIAVAEYVEKYNEDQSLADLQLNGEDYITELKINENNTINLSIGQDGIRQMKENDVLEIIKDELTKANIRQHINVNNFGYSQIEREIAARIVKKICR